MVISFTVVLIGMVLVVLLMIREAFKNTVKRTVLECTEFPCSSEMNIFFISDIHRRSIHDSIIAEAIGKADFVIIGGDLTERGVPFSKVADNLRKLKKIGPVYFVWGNNDYEADIELLQNIFEVCEVRVLKNEAVCLAAGETDIVLVGIDDLTTNDVNLDHILSSRKNKEFRILASHNPAIIEQLNEEHKISLVLSGHTHGGQIRFFGIGPYDKGRVIKFPFTTMLISNGYGTSIIPFRLGAEAETHLVTIRRREERKA